jgi:ribonuclease HI
MIYINCDASYHNGWAGIAYHSDHLDSHSRLVECKNNGEAELRALLLAMSAAEQANLRDVIFRTDCESTARPWRGESEHLRSWRAEACLHLAARQPGWSIVQVSRAENVLAHALARQARRSREDVSVSLDTQVAEALIERAGIAETPKGRWRVAPGRHATSITAALNAALVKLAADAPSLAARGIARRPGDRRIASAGQEGRSEANEPDHETRDRRPRGDAEERRICCAGVADDLCVWSSFRRP